jgi:secreted trypsin-like serine protease
LIYKKTGRQIGVVSYGATCDNNPRKLPGVYAKIADNLDFIRNVMNNN